MQLRVTDLPVAQETASTFATLPPFAFTFNLRPLCPSVESSVLTPHWAIQTSTIQHSLASYATPQSNRFDLSPTSTQVDSV
jgi:hypothetical protein